MPTVLLPSSAAAFAPRSPPNVVLSRKVAPWLTATLKRVNRVKRPLNNVTQHTRCLTETLSSQNAIWTLCSMMFAKAPEAELRKDENPLVEGLFNFQMIHIEAYVVHVDMVSRNEVAFKLTPETIEALVEFHKDVYSVDTAASTWNWPGKHSQLKKLQDEFIQAANKFVYRTNAEALEGLEEDGSGELPSGLSEEAKISITGLYVPLLPPPPRVVDVLRPVPLLPSSTGPETWWIPPSASIEPWKVLSPSPPPASTNDSNPDLWASMTFSDDQLSPSPSYSQPFTTAYSPYDNMAATSAITSLPLPSMLVQPLQQCATAANMAGFGWGDFSTAALPYSMIM
ncbi:hypothetical protein N7495_005854 [Penicillium taxi]|uniref:uncharacterized protein n=1 Tax=Penicillium taxi TaxID=168475 RepID=UPI0025453941|nr:uncharacterized protein N7495_005854 [Penicillium taxi]KAJ5894163.1 hypothetical protein N7495_005854 [Penicillium taxi]